MLGIVDNLSLGNCDLRVAPNLMNNTHHKLPSVRHSTFIYEWYLAENYCSVGIDDEMTVTLLIMITLIMTIISIMKPEYPFPNSSYYLP